MLPEAPKKRGRGRPRRDDNLTHVAGTQFSSLNGLSSEFSGALKRVHPVDAQVGSRLK